MEHNHSHMDHKTDTCHSSEPGSPGMSHGSAQGFLNRFWIVTILLIPLVISNVGITGFLGLPHIQIHPWILFAISTVIFGFGLVFFEHAWMEIKMRTPGMMSLVSLAVASGYIFSVFSTFMPELGVQFYLEISTLIWVLLFGHYLEAKSSSAAGNALNEVAKLLPKKAHKLMDGKEIEVDIIELQVGDVVIVKPGEKVPADGIITEGFANVDEALVSGESKPVIKKEGAEVVAGSICLDGSLTIRVERVGESSTIGQIQKLITLASQTKPRSQKIADRAAGILTFVAALVAVLTVLVWTIVVGQTFVFAITLAITVLVIACPHALGLAIPTVTTISTSLAVKNGFFIKDLSKIETIKNVDYVVFDKTGTLTEGEFGVQEVQSTNGKDEDAILQITAALEQHSSHIIGHSIIKHSQSKNIELPKIENFKNIAGQGVSAEIDGKTYFAGNERLITSLNIQYSTPKDTASTIVYLATKKELLGYILLADAIKTESYKAVKRLHEMGIKVVMLTGDNKHVARAVSEELGIDTYFADVLPEDKYTHIKKLQEDGSVVLMVGDGVNDAPALIQADAGVAIGAGTDVAVESGDVVLMDSDPSDIVRLIKLSKKVYSKMVQNLVWALGYNIVAIPLAAGVLAAWGIFLRPEIGALVMSLSTVIVVANALLLKRVDLSK